MLAKEETKGDTYELLPMLVLSYLIGIDAHSVHYLVMILVLQNRESAGVASEWQQS